MRRSLDCVTRATRTGTPSGIEIITFFTPIFPAKQKEIRAEDENEACPARICPNNAGKSAPVSRFSEQTFALSFRSATNPYDTDSCETGPFPPVLLFISLCAAGRAYSLTEADCPMAAHGPLLCLS